MGGVLASAFRRRWAEEAVGDSQPLRRRNDGLETAHRGAISSVRSRLDRLAISWVAVTAAWRLVFLRRDESAIAPLNPPASSRAPKTGSVRVMSIRHAHARTTRMWFIVAGIAVFAAFAATVANASGSAGDGLPRIATQSGYLLPENLQVKPYLINDGLFEFFAGPGKASRHPRIASLRWSNWTSTSASGSGSDWRDNCKPGCGNGTYTPYPVTITAQRPRRGQGYLLFTRLLFVYRQRVPWHEHRDFSLTLEYSPHHGGGDLSWQYSSP